jgi:flagellar biosynthetic protein FlhB
VVKDINGNPLIKQEQRKRGHSMLMKAMMNEVPNADVVLTNPTHLAVALRYDNEHPIFTAPYIVAMGAGHIAERIKKIAAENGVPVIENKPLARQLYKLCDIGEEIPEELFELIGEILAMVYRMKGKLGNNIGENE